MRIATKNPLLRLLLLLTAWACLAAPPCGAKTASWQNSGPETASSEMTGWEAAPRLGFGSLAAENASDLLVATESVGATGAKVISGFSEVETGIINEAQGILGSPEMDTIRAANSSGQSATVTVNGRLIQYEPGLPASGMTMFGENGFLIGPEAFASESELQQTVLHELYRLNTSASSAGVSASLATQETQAAAGFAARAVNYINGSSK
jgi:hypothetical protein